MSSIITILVTQLDWQVDIIYTFTAHFANVDLTQEPSFICLSYLFFVIGWILVCPPNILDYLQSYVLIYNFVNSSFCP